MFRMQRPYRAGTTCRSAFSLAEVMIAIGILGIGMIMVAATFPVGLDQSRVVADETMKSAVADEAFASLQMLIDDPSPEPRVGVNTDAPVTFRQAILDSLLLPNLTEPTPPPDISPESLSSKLNFRVKVPAKWDPDGVDINAWLGSPNSLLGDTSETLGPRLRRYPSLAAADDDTEVPPFVWSVLFRKPSDSAPGQNVQFMVFVNRRSARCPVMVKLNDTTRNAESAIILMSDYESSSPSFDDAMTTSQFSDGAYIVNSNAEIFKVQDARSSTDRVVLNKAIGNTFWFVPVDPATGRSPCIGVFSRTLSLN